MADSCDVADHETQPPPIRVLLVDDEIGFRDATARRLQLRGFQVIQAGDGADGDAIMADDPPDVVVCDLKMPGTDGLTLMRRRIAERASVAWIILTGQASVDTAIEGIKLGAFEYLRKPIDVEDLERHIRAAFESNAPARTLAAIRANDVDGRHGIVGRSEHVEQVRMFLRKASTSHQPVLLTGESGTGKEVVARAIHEESDRRARPFVTFNGAALSDDLQAAELLGHVQSDDNGAVGNKIGLLEMASGGTLFIDEISDLTLANQAKLLRVMDTGELVRLGDARERTVDVRIVAATFRNLDQMVAEDSFTKDLLHRISVLPFGMQPLREHAVDIPPLIQHFLDRHGRRTGMPKRLAPEALVALQAHSWPGNIRELANTIERAATLCDDFTIRGADLQIGLQHGIPTSSGVSSRLADIEQAHILCVLDAHGGNKQAAARALGISRMKLYRKLEQYGVETNDV
jgi:DNA-binding NtrC family response regulator